MSLKPSYSGSITETVDTREVVAYLAKASHEPFNSLGIHIYLKNAFLCNTSKTSSELVYRNKYFDKYTLFNNSISY